MGRSILAVNLAVGALLTGLLPAGTPDIPPNHYTPRPVAVAGIRTPVLSLNGTWSFNPAPPKGFETLTERSAKGFKPIEVPGDWTMQGHSVKPGTAAGYLKTVIIPADWRGAKILLRSDSAQSLATFWVNGKLARTHEGGFTAFEMDITELCRPGAAKTYFLRISA